MIRTLLFICGLALAVLGLALTLQPLRFGATARLITEALFALDPQTERYDPYFLQNQFEFIKSPTVLTNALQRLQAQPTDSKELKNLIALNPVEASRFLNQYITLRPIRGTRLIDINVAAPEPRAATSIANTVAESYRDQSAFLWNAKQPQLIKAWEKRLAQHPEMQVAHQRVAALLKELKVTIHEYEEVSRRSQIGYYQLQDVSSARAQQLVPFIEAQHDLFQQLLANNDQYSFLLWGHSDLSLRTAIEFPELHEQLLPPVKIIEPAVLPTQPLPNHRATGSVLLVVGLLAVATGIWLRRVGLE